MEGWSICTQKIRLPLVFILLMCQTPPWTNRNRIDLESEASQLLHRKSTDFNCKNGFQKGMPLRAVHPPRNSKEQSTPIKIGPTAVEGWSICKKIKKMLLLVLTLISNPRYKDPPSNTNCMKSDPCRLCRGACKFAYKPKQASHTGPDSPPPTKWCSAGQPFHILLPAASCCLLQ